MPQNNSDFFAFFVVFRDPAVALFGSHKATRESSQNAYIMVPKNECF